MASSNQSTSGQNADTNLVAARKTGNTWGGIRFDSRTDAYKDMTDESRQRVDKLVKQIGDLEKAGQTPENKLKAAKLVEELSEIYATEANTATTPEIAKQSRDIASYWSDYAKGLEENGGKNKKLIPNEGTATYVYNGNGDANIASTANEPVSSDSTATVSEQIVATALGSKLTSDRVKNFQEFAKLQNGKLDSTTLEQIGEKYLAGYTEKPLETAKIAVNSATNQMQAQA
jgi:vacuolar-type H+-ATPase subunit I/STV1